jgi:hypothetical protein
MHAGARGRVMAPGLLLGALAMVFLALLVPVSAGAQDPGAEVTPTMDANITLPVTEVPGANITPAETAAETPMATPVTTSTETPAVPPEGDLSLETQEGAILLAAPSGISISVNPVIAIFGGTGGMRIPGSYQSPVTVTVQVRGVQNWYLRAEDTSPGTPSKGFLYCAAPPRNLTTPLGIWDFTLPTPGFRNLGRGNTIFFSSQKPGKTTVDARFMQNTTVKDLSCTYSMVVTFTGTTN